MNSLRAQAKHAYVCFASANVGLRNLHTCKGEDTVKKLRLMVEELTVEQFQVEPSARVSRGTVHGHDDTEACTDGGCTLGCTQANCSQYCGDSMNANTAPCLFCPRELDTNTCLDTSCC